MPALLLGLALTAYLLFEPFHDQILAELHIGFFAVNIITIGFLVKYNQNRPLFFVLTLVLCHISINYFKHLHGVIYYTSPDYLNLTFLAASGFLFFYFLPNRPLSSKDTINFLIIIAAAMTLAELLNRHGISLDYSLFDYMPHGLQMTGFILFTLFIIIQLFHSSIKDEILTTTLLFATINIMLGFYFSNEPSAQTAFFLNASLTICYGTIRSIRYDIRKDVVTGLDNGNSFLKAAEKFPLKYGLGIICIDDYKHLAQIFKKSGINELAVMITQKIRQSEPEALLYRYRVDEFIIVFPQAEKGTSFERVDNIRRNIAAAEFILSGRKKPLKLTVSCSVADKKRSDANVLEVFYRAGNILQKTYKFTQNVTSKA